MKELEYERFIEWTATPSKLRVPLTQKELGEQLGVHETTFSEWKKRKDFWLNVRDKIKDWAKSKTADIIDAVYQGALDVGEKGQASNARLWLQWVDDWEEKVKVETDSSDEVKKIAEQTQNIYSDFKKTLDELKGQNTKVSTSTKRVDKNAS